MDAMTAVPDAEFHVVSTVEELMAHGQQAQEQQPTPSYTTSVDGQRDDEETHAIKQAIDELILDNRSQELKYILLMLSVCMILLAIVLYTVLFYLIIEVTRARQR
ncbi:hypothetical protein BIW11_09904 [Tropilaelaps mercedesae]|uniref:Uncharacterized protein n=1 Tax=Tropilaelaps mercedesae TaxID=418985 RepID=A0A1V9XII3_9ACAR|nr:hypothetical protein BIW11_09904 [Tropilaelaps mercedesae]